MRSFYRDTATRLRPEVVSNAHGQARDTWTESALTGLRITAVAGTELDGLTEATHTLRGAVTLDIRASDRVRWTDVRGVEHIADVHGIPVAHRGISGAVAHLVVQLVEGDV
ncbi:hypothetical protein AB2L57_10680 [Microbacterium sp. HA-8]|uniref:hypothetical protein n=1 Tax=Microbacterium sp. HA-8 TaxID=3234200 RepID=UPI0038F78CDB